MESKNNYFFSKPCECVLEKRQVKRLNIIPPKFKGITLESIVPNRLIHERQPEIHAACKANPCGSYALAGAVGTGKTMFMWALYREAVFTDRKVIACTLSELINNYRQIIQASIAGQPGPEPLITAEQLRQTHTKYAIFLDDIDKAKPTEYAMEQLFELADAADAFCHQIVITTNLRISALSNHFARSDERYGEAIIRRLVGQSTVFELF